MLLVQHNLNTISYLIISYHILSSSSSLSSTFFPTYTQLGHSLHCYILSSCILFQDDHIMQATAPVQMAKPRHKTEEHQSRSMPNLVQCRSPICLFALLPRQEPSVCAVIISDSKQSSGYLLHQCWNESGDVLFLSQRSRVH